jgi:hypothetical protein
MNLSEDTSTTIVQYTSVTFVCTGILYIGHCFGVLFIPLYFCGCLIVFVALIRRYIDK